MQNAHWRDYFKGNQRPLAQELQYLKCTTQIKIKKYNKIK